jgi:hypothetical protein
MNKGIKAVSDPVDDQGDSGGQEIMNNDIEQRDLCLGVDNEQQQQGCYKIYKKEIGGHHLPRRYKSGRCLLAYQDQKTSAYACQI